MRSIGDDIEPGQIIAIGTDEDRRAIATVRIERAQAELIVRLHDHVREWLAEQELLIEIENLEMFDLNEIAAAVSQWLHKMHQQITEMKAARNGGVR